METPAQLAKIFAEEERIGRARGELWPDTHHSNGDEYIAFLKRVPTGSGLQGVMATLAKEKRK